MRNDHEATVGAKARFGQGAGRSAHHPTLRLMPAAFFQSDSLPGSGHGVPRRSANREKSSNPA